MNFQRWTWLFIVLVLAAGTCPANGAPPSKVLILEQEARALKLSANGKFLAVLEKDGGLTIMDTALDRPWGRFPPAEKIAVLPAFTADERRLATVHGDGKIRLWDLTQPKKAPIRVIDHPGTTAIAFGDKGRLLAAGDAQGGITLWDAKTGAQTPVRNVTTKGEPIRNIAFTDDGANIACETPNGIHLWKLEAAAANAKQGKEIATIREDSKDTRPLSFAPNSKSLALPSKNKLKILDTDTGKSIGEAELKAPPSALKFFTKPTDDGLSIGYMDKANNSGVVNLKDGKLSLPRELAKKPGHDYEAATISGDGAKMASVSDGKNVTISDFKDDSFVPVQVFYGTNRQKCTTPASDRQRYFGEYFVSAIAWQVGGKLLAACLVPALLVLLFLKLGATGRWICGVACGIVALALLVLLGRWWISAEGLVVLFLALACAGGVSLWRRKAPDASWWLAVPLLLLVVAGSWVLIAFLGAAWKADRDHDPERPAFLYGNQPSEELHWGDCIVTIPPTYKGDGISANYRPDTFFSYELPEDPREHVTIKGVRDLAEADFFKALVKAVKERNERAAFIFVHGFNNSFEEAAFRTAFLWYDLGFPGPPIFYSWPAQGSFGDYATDEDMASVSWRPFKEFLHKIAERSEAKKLYVIAHSMGNRVLCNALRELNQGRWQGQEAVLDVVFAAPDIYREDFVRNFLPDLVGKGPRLTLYANDEDFPLNFNQGIFHKTPRAGQAGASLILYRGLDTVDVSKLKTGMSRGHDYAFSVSQVRQDIRLLWLERKDPLGRHLPAVHRGELTYWEIVRGVP